MASISQLHSDIKNLAGQKPALALSFEALNSILLDNFRNAKSMVFNSSIAFEGYDKLSLKFSRFTIAAPNPADPTSFTLKVVDIAGDIFATISSDFTATLIVYDTHDSSRVFSQIEFTISNFKTRLSTTAPYLIIGVPDFDIQTKITNDQNRSSAIAASGIPEENIQRVEGAVAFAMPRRIVLSMFSTISKINLSDHYTAFELRGNWALNTVNNCLIVIPSDGIAIRENNGCPQRDSVPDLSVTVPVDPLQSTFPVNTSYNNLPSTPSRISPKNGFASIYLPKPTLEQRFSQVKPAISYAVSDDGFIGYDLNILVSLGYIGLKIDPARVGILINLNFTMTAHADLNIDVPCVGRTDLESVDMILSPSALSIFNTFAVSHGKLVMESQIESLNIGAVDVSLHGLTRWAYLAGGAVAIRAFIFNTIATNVLERVIPNMLRKAIKNEVNSKNFQLIDLEDLQRYALVNQSFQEVSFSGDSDSILVGMLSDG